MEEQSDHYVYQVTPAKILDLLGLMEPSRGPLASGNNRNYRVLRQSATGEL